MRNKAPLILLLLSFNASANVIQYFTGISYSNPAELFTTPKNQMLIGATGFNTLGRFNGTAFNFNTMGYDAGVAHTRTTSLLPFGRVAKRINEKIVVGVDVSEPFHSNLNWGNNAFTRYAATQTYLTDVDISPRLAYTINKQWNIGAGVNFNFLNNNESNWAMPTGPTTYANLTNRTSSFGLGTNIRFYYLFNQTNFLGATYYAKIRQHTRGFSSLGEQVNNSVKFDFNMPATTVVSYVHIFNKTWLANLKLYYSEWSANQYVRFINTASSFPEDFTFKMHFRNSAAVVAAVRRQMTEKLGLTFIGVIDDGPEKEKLRVLNFPADTQYFLALSADYHFTKSTSVDLLYGYGFENTRMNNFLEMGPKTIPFTTGDTRLSANVIELRLKIEN